MIKKLGLAKANNEVRYDKKAKQTLLLTLTLTIVEINGVTCGLSTTWFSQGLKALEVLYHGHGSRYKR